MVPPRPPHPARPLRVLCCIDNDLLRRSLCMLLENVGHAADSTPNTGEALACLQRATYNLLITDNQTPYVNGIELVSKARAAGFVGSVIIYSFLLSPHERQVYIKFGNVAFVEKGMDVEALLAAINDVVSGREPS
ncbi:MAG: response regulator [Opitutaceae bacterium]|nr:response regulator [Opitutaceae bacterium]